MKQIEEVSRVNEVDELITNLAKHINELVESKDDYPDVVEKTKALAELVSARAQMID